MTREIQEKWNKCLELIRDNIGQERFDTWFACAEVVSYSDGLMTLRLPSHFFFEKYEDDFYEILTLALRRVFGRCVRLEYEIPVVANDKNSNVKLKSPQQAHIINDKLNRSVNNSPVTERKINFDPQLVSSLNFENYCVGESNRLPVTIAEFIANNPHKPEFNPFFLYGNVGVGKTHLIQAIGIRIKEKNPNAKVLFIPMRQFQTMYTNAVLEKVVPSFINWFQEMDVILFDDLQELSNKSGTADALFPIFNHLQRNNKNLIFTCDRPPMELDGIADRLIDRFKWGVTEPLPNPDYELRKKILTFKAGKNGLDLPDEVTDLIAAKVDGSVRELENVVTGLLTRAIVKNAPITIGLAHEVISHIVRPKEKKSINFEMIVESTAEYFNLNPDAIFSKSKIRDIADARQLIMYLSHKHTSLSSPAIGNKLNRKHATVLHGINAVKDRLSYSKELSVAVCSIEAELLK